MYSNFDAEGLLATIEFRVKEDVPAGKYEDLISLDFDMLDPNGKPTNDAITYLPEGTIQSKTLGAEAAYVEYGNVALSLACSEHTWGDFETVTELSCTVDGVRKRTCTVCGAPDEEITKSEGHKWGDLPTVEPACEEGGYDIKECSVCHETEKSNFKDALGHKVDNWGITKPETCTEDGEETGKCARCGADQTRTRPHKHIMTDWITDIEPKCGVRGHKYKECTRCKDGYEDEILNALEHQPGEWEVDVEATCTKPGLDVIKCKLCGLDVDKLQTPIDSSNHKWGDWEIVRDATSSQDGERKRTCERCDAEETKPIPATGGSGTNPPSDNPPSSNPPSSNPPSGSTTTPSGSNGSQDTKKVLTDQLSGIEVSGDFADGTRLNVVFENASQINTAIIYDITLTDQRGNIIQPNGNVTVKIPAPSGWITDRLRVYRMESNNSYTNMNAAYDNGYLTFTTNHFSKYVVTAYVLDGSSGSIGSGNNSSSSSGSSSGGDHNVNTANYPSTAIIMLTVLLAGSVAFLKPKRRR